MKQALLSIFLVSFIFSFPFADEQQEKQMAELKAAQEVLDQEIAPYLQKYTDETILATVNEQKIIFKDLKQGYINTLKNHVSLLKDKPLDTTFAKDYLKQLIDRQIMKRIVLNEALKMKLTVSDQNIEEALNKIKEQNKGHYDEFLNYNDLTEESLKHSLHDQLIVNELFKFHDSKVPGLTEEELKKAYEKNRPLFKIPRKIRFSAIHIKNADKSNETLEKNKKLILDLYQRIQSGQSFENLAKNFSDDKNTRKIGGDNGYKFVSEVEKMYEPLLTMKVNELKMVSFEEGAYIAKLTEDAPEQEVPFNEIKEKLRDSLTTQRIQQNRAQKIQEFLKASKIVISKGL